MTTEILDPVVVASGVINLISPIRGLRVSLVPPRQETSLGGALREVPGSRKQVVFREGKAQMPSEWWPLLREHGAYTGIGRQKLVYLADDPKARLMAPESVQVVDGAITSNHGRGAVRAPLDGWDTMTVSSVREAIAAGLIEDPLTALNYESITGHRRQGVIVALSEAVAAQLGSTPVAEVVQAPAPAVSEEPAPGGWGEVMPAVPIPPDQKVE